MAISYTELHAAESEVRQAMPGLNGKAFHDAVHRLIYSRKEELKFRRQREAEEELQRAIRLIAYTKANPIVPMTELLPPMPVLEVA